MGFACYLSMDAVTTARCVFLNGRSGSAESTRCMIFLPANCQRLASHSRQRQLSELFRRNPRVFWFHHMFYNFACRPQHTPTAHGCRDGSAALGTAMNSQQQPGGDCSSPPYSMVRCVQEIRQNGPRPAIACDGTSREHLRLHRNGEGFRTRCSPGLPSGDRQRPPSGAAPAATMAGTEVYNGLPGMKDTALERFHGF